MAFSATGGILTETASSSLNRDIGGGPSTLKRKRANVDDEYGLQLFTIKPHASSIFDKSLSLKPLFTVARQYLPLSYLCPGDSSLPIGSSRLFSSTINVIDRELNHTKAQSVLIAMLFSNGRLCAVERVQRGIYALCILGEWVNEEDLRALQGRPAITSSQISSVESIQLPAGKASPTWWIPTRLDREDLYADKHLAGPRLKSRRLLRTCPDPVEDGGKPQSSTKDGNAIVPQVEIANVTVQVNDAPTEPIEPALAEQTTQEIFEKVRYQYLETLYISKTSVAYFAKGPLARARAAVMSEDAGESKPQELVELLRSAILPLKKLDHKYKDSLPKSVEQCTSGGLSDGQEAESQPTKNRRSKKKCLGKNGMYPDEDDFVAKWWKGRSLSNPADSHGESHESECKRLLSDLRFRETQLQILLILESITLENSIPPTEITEPAQGDTTNNASVSTSKSKQKKPEDLKSLLDLLLDRLCIWQSLAADQGLSSEATGPSKTKSKTGAKKENDVLRDFCAEVIVPFYASRLPDRCKAITRKLGGLSSVSPVRPPLAKAASTSQVLPGATIRRERPDKPRRSLQRVLTDEKATSQLRPPSLVRSNTAPANRPIKHEEPESLLQSIRAANRGGIQKPKRIDNREVDLNAVAKQHEAKLKKMNALKEHKKELDEAINALRKPNRSLVSKDFADSVVQRVSTSSRKPKNPLRNPTGLGVQVMATPKVNRKRDAGSRRPHAARIHSSPDSREPDLPSSETHIPSSVIRPGPSKDGEVNTANGHAESRIQARSLYTIQETPSRGPSRQSDPLGLKQKEQHGGDDELQIPFPPLPKPPKASNSPFKVPAHPLQTPRAKRQRLLPNTFSTPTQQGPSNDARTSQPSNEMRGFASETPLKPSNHTIIDEDEDELALIPASSPPVPPGPQQDRSDPVGGKSIYESLGWDNYDDDIDELA